MSILEEREEKKRKELEEKNRKKMECEQKKKERDEEKKKKDEERARKAEERARAAEERAKKKEEMKAKKAASSIARKSKSSSLPGCSSSSTLQTRSKTTPQEAPEINSNICCVCFRSYEDDFVEETGMEWVQCVCKRWLHEECIDNVVRNDKGEELLCPFCVC